MKIFIREATAKDAAAIAELSNQLGYTISVAATLKNIDTIIKNKNEIVWVAVYQEKIVGWIHAFLTTRIESGSFCEIGGLVVDDQCRRMGIGKLLVEHIRSWCIDKGIPTLRVRSNVKRTEAHHFYLQLGFGESKQQTVFEINLSSR